jgi:gliding motility-associated-like protein
MSYFYQKIILKSLFLLIFILYYMPVKAQTCTGGINSFPYNEGFESSDGNWVPGGAQSDWEWGSPIKALIDIAGGGNKCWITGGIANSSYNNNENSWLQSPCFNFSSLTSPRISFKIYWETERKFDGAALQYSINNGLNWSPVGTSSSNANCLGENWYNTTAITFLSNTAGWSGTILPSNGSCLGGSGSGGWILARHDLSPLAGLNNILFRFVFGAGSTCNSFEGVAIDDIEISESPSNGASFTYSCKPGKIVDFVNSSPCAAGSVWDFGDPASGAANASTQTNASHQYSNPGTYTVRLISRFPAGNQASSVQQIIVLGVTANIDQPILCNTDANAVLSVNATGGTDPYNFEWSTSPPQFTQSITNVAAGNYTVTVSSGNACITTATILVAAPEKITATFKTEDEICSANNGVINTTLLGGTAPYTYTWSNGASSPNIQNLTAGIYSLQVKDANQCRVDFNNLSIINQAAPLVVNLGKDTVICPGETLLLNAGSFDSYLWQDQSKNPTFTVRQTGRYVVTVGSGAGCSGSDTINVLVDCSDIYFPSAFTPNNDQKNDLYGPAGNFSLITEFKMVIFNRLGQMVFTSHDPNRKWDGTFKGEKMDNASFVWMAQYNINKIYKSKKGSFTLIR